MTDDPRDNAQFAAVWELVADDVEASTSLAAVVRAFFDASHANAIWPEQIADLIALADMKPFAGLPTLEGDVVALWRRMRTAWIATLGEPARAHPTQTSARIIKLTGAQHRLIPDPAGERAVVRAWLTVDAEHAALAVLQQRYAVRDGIQHIITTALYHAGRAKIDPEIAREAAVDLFWDVMEAHQEKFSKLHWHMVDAARLSLSQHRDFVAAGRAAAVLGSAGNATPGMVAAALRIAARTA